MYCRILQFFCDMVLIMKHNEDWGWPALCGPGSVLSEDIQWVEMSVLPTEPSLQPAQLYSDGVDGDDLPLYV